MSDDLHITYQHLFKTPVGQEVLEDLRAFCHVNHTTMAGDGNSRLDPLVMAMNEGKRLVALYIDRHLSYIESDIEQAEDDDYE